MAELAGLEVSCGRLKEARADCHRMKGVRLGM